MAEQFGRDPHGQLAERPTRSRRSGRLTGGFGADVVIDAVGRPETYEQAFYARDLAGTVVLVGVPTPDMRIDLPLLDFFGRGGSLKSCWYGDCLPSRDFPMLIDLYLQGRLPLDEFVSETIGLDDVEAAFEKMHHGDVLRSVVRVLTRDARRSIASSRAASSASTAQDFDVDNNVWIVGDENEVVVVDAAHDAGADPRRDRRPSGAPRSCAPTGTTTTSPRRPTSPLPPAPPIHLHPPTGCSGTRCTPDRRHAQPRRRRGRHRRGRRPAGDAHARSLARRGVPLRAGARRRAAAATRCSTADRGRPAARSPTSRRSSTRSASGSSALPSATRVLTGHGEETTVGSEASSYDEWVARGH